MITRCTIQYEQTLECSVTMRTAFITITLKIKEKILQSRLIKFCDTVCPFRNIRNNKFSRLTTFTALLGSAFSSLGHKVYSHTYKKTCVIAGFRCQVAQHYTLCIITQRVVVTSYRRFATTYRSHPQGSFN